MHGFVLCDPCCREDQKVVRHYKDKRGKTKYTGGERLKSTQAYPEAFGTAVVDAFLATKESIQGTPPASDSYALLTAFYIYVSCCMLLRLCLNFLLS